MTVHTYEGASITLNGVAFPSGRVTTVDVDDELEGPPAPMNVKPYEVTFTMTVPGGDLADLARQAVRTPALDAEKALSVFEDALIARGELDSPLQVFFSPDAWTRRRREAAFNRAEDLAYGPFYRILRAADEAAHRALLRPAPTIETAQGAWLDQVAEYTFGVRRASSIAEGAETDVELRERCLARLRTLNPTRFDPDYGIDIDDHLGRRNG